MNDLGNILNVPLEIYTCVYLEFRVVSGGETGRALRKTADRLVKRFCRLSKEPTWTNIKLGIKPIAKPNTKRIRQNRQKIHRQPKYA